MIEDLQATWEKYYANSDNYLFLEFDDETNKRHARPDIHAFLLLDSLVPNAGNDMVSAAEHDQIYLDTDPEEFAKVATEEDVKSLIRAGVMYDKRLPAFSMFV